MILIHVAYIYLIFYSVGVYGNDLVIEPIETTWRFANVICESSNFILMPGRSYRKADLIRSLTTGQAVWVKGWRMVAENQADSKGNIRFLKTDFIPSYNVLIRRYICEHDNGTFTVTEVPGRSRTDQFTAEKSCQENGGKLARIGRDDVRQVLDIIGDKIPHWSSAVTSDDSIAKQCLAARRTSSGIKYYYEDCESSLPFVCLQDEKTSSVFAPVVSIRYVSFTEFAAEITRIASRTSLTPSTEEETTFPVTDEDTQTPPTTYGVTSSITTEGTVLSTTENATTPFVYTGFTKSENGSTVSKLTSVTTPSTTEDESSKVEGNTTFQTDEFVTHSTKRGITFKSLINDQNKHVTLQTLKLKGSTVSSVSASTPYEKLFDIFPHTSTLDFSTETHKFTLQNSPSSVSEMRYSSVKRSNRSDADTYLMSFSLTTDIIISGAQEIIKTSSTNETLPSSLDNQLETFITMSSSMVTSKAVIMPVSYLRSAMTDSQINISSSTQRESIYPSQTRVIYSTNEAMKDFNTFVLNTTASGSESANVGFSKFIGEIESGYTENTYLSEFRRDSETAYNTLTVNTSSNINLWTTRSPVTDVNGILKDTYSTGNTNVEPSQVPDVSTAGQHGRQSMKYSSIGNTNDQAIKTSFTLYSGSRTTEYILDKTPMTMFGESVKQTVDDTAVYYGYDYNYDYTPEEGTSSITLNSSIIHSKIKPSSKQALSVHISDGANRYVSSYITSAVQPQIGITPTVTKDVIMSQDISKEDLDSINRTSTDADKDAWINPMWMAIVIIAVMTVISLVIAVVLYKRRRKQKKIADIRTNDTQHPLVKKPEAGLPNDAFTRKICDDKPKDSDPNQDVFVDEAYDL